MKTNLKHHAKSAQHAAKKTHELFKNSKICNYTNALLLILILSVSILATQMFLNNQNKVVPDAEIRFSELSKDKKILGTIMPASCQSAPFLVANGDGNYSGCATQTCWDNSIITPAAGGVCPNKTCWDGSILTPAQIASGQVCSSQHCGYDPGFYNNFNTPQFNLCYCYSGEVKKIRTVSTTIDTNNPSQCTAPVTTITSNISNKANKFLMTLAPEKAYAGPTGPICLTIQYAFCESVANPPIVNIRFE